MSAWTIITGSIQLEEMTEDDFLIHYGLFSHYLVGSEGGLNIHFTRTFKKSWSSSSESEYQVEPFQYVNGVFITGSLRDFNEEKAVEASEAIEEFLARLKESFDYRIGSGSFIISPDNTNYYYTVSLNKEYVHTQMIHLSEDERIEINNNEN